MDQPTHTNRRRAGAFGVAADSYHRYRPRYPHSLIAGLVERDGMRVLDVGAGTGIASVQLRDAGAEVLAIEPDPRMAHVAEANGIRVEQATFEDWDPGDRLFDLVVFAQSFHWVEPHSALDKVASILTPAGHLALLSNRITPIAPSRAELDKAFTGLLGSSERRPIDAVHSDDLPTTFADHGYAVERRHVDEHRHYPGDDWVRMVFTHSNVLTLDEQTQAELRARLERVVGADGVDAENHATAVIATPSS
ncbi:SAM-dependent methyltransferase [Mycolicibacterium sp. BK556]|uniref:class I SAM-dependent methyltransferase n=1 Tax=Mycobacteriaceae TaxID=1762 RepID=UPI00105CFFB6|nr:MULTISPECIES: class I SAM-dependent methyltransferase [Mycobacteriaceae]MBB3605646.1 SAM-dependent methyltransferase [Mycolicibacterium sp. BK556]MBB3635857.1 SAM-dependent methyltransferase [Mycolicibacterium sp. BK607]MBB3753270.1 SAM-dependent methyltransferase [Mycolicibacterium sp. BK634]TDO08967.1 methyltransferase family protein [Mycobacterium sp. BK086]